MLRRPLGPAMKISLYDGTDATEWDDFVSEFDEVTFYHLFDWYRFLSDVFWHQPKLLVARDNGGRLAGVLPLGRVRAPGLGSKLIAIPYQATAGTPLVRDAEVARALVAEAIEMGRKSKAGYVEIRGEAGSRVLSDLGFMERHAGTHDCTVPILKVNKSTIVRGHRQDLNRVDRLGIHIDEAHTMQEWRLFYEMFEEIQRTFAAIGLGWSFFRELFLRMPDKAKVRLARLNGEIIGGAFLLCHHKTIISKQAVVKPEHNRTGLGKGLVWSTLNWGREVGYEQLNLGISLKSQAHVLAFKEGFGGISRPVSSYVFPLRQEPPSFEDLYEGYGLAKKVWTRMPLPATKMAGALMTRWFC